jgi:cell wall-associated NlpC family hydrolase
MAQIPDQGYSQLLAAIGAPDTPQTRQFLSAWQRAEGGTATYNPFNTTQSWTGATDYNGVHVRNYRDLASGIAATAKTLKNGYYGQLLNDLRSGRASARQLATDVANSPWGTGSGVLRVLGSTAVPTTVHNAPNVPAKNPVQKTGADPAQRAAITALKLTGADPMVINLLSMGMQKSTPAQATRSTVADTQGVATGNSLVKTAMTQLGMAYQWGGPAVLGKNTDCSGLLKATLAQHGINVSRTTYDQWKEGRPVNPKALQPGDGVFFHMGPRGPEHVGIYIGGGKFIEDPHTGSVVRVSNLASYPGFVGARRYT